MKLSGLSFEDIREKLMRDAHENISTACLWTCIKRTAIGLPWKPHVIGGRPRFLNLDEEMALASWTNAQPDGQSMEEFLQAAVEIRRDGITSISPYLQSMGCFTIIETLNQEAYCFSFIAALLFIDNCRAHCSSPAMSMFADSNAKVIGFPPFGRDLSWQPLLQSALVISGSARTGFGKPESFPLLKTNPCSHRMSGTVRWIPKSICAEIALVSFNLAHHDERRFPAEIRIGAASQNKLKNKKIVRIYLL
jgi:hypothetical protein